MMGLNLLIRHTCVKIFFWKRTSGYFNFNKKYKNYLKCNLILVIKVVFDILNKKDWTINYSIINFDNRFHGVNKRILNPFLNMKNNNTFHKTRDYKQKKRTNTKIRLKTVDILRIVQVQLKGKE